MRRRRPSDETLVTLRGKLEELATRSVERQHLLQDCADLHGVSVATVYRALREQFRPRSLYRRDRGRPRLVPQPDMERFCELLAAMKLRTTNQKGRHLSTGRALELLVEHGIETPDGLVQAPPGLLTRTTVNRYLKAWGWTTSGWAGRPRHRVPGGACQRLLAIRSVAVGPQAGAGAAVDRAGPRPADADAVQRRR